MSAAPTLTTDRLVIRAITVADFQPYAAMWADERVTTFIGGEPRPRDLSWLKFTQAAGFWPLLGHGYWSVTDRAGGGWLGVAGFASMERGIAELEGFPESGWAYAADAWGRGIASEALGAMVDWVDAAGLGETRCLIDDGNAASVRVAERHGYAPCADLGGRRIFRRPAASASGRG